LLLLLKDHYTESFKYLTHILVKMVLPDIANIVAGAYKGWMNADGQDVDATYLAYVLASTSVLAGISQYFKAKKHVRSGTHAFEALTGRQPRENSPAAEGVKRGLICIPIGAAQIAVGYGLGYAAYKILK
jgi:hypothetical protein